MLYAIIEARQSRPMEASVPSGVDTPLVARQAAVGCQDPLVLRRDADPGPTASALLEVSPGPLYRDFARTGPGHDLDRLHATDAPFGATCDAEDGRMEARIPG